MISVWVPPAVSAGLLLAVVAVSKLRARRRERRAGLRPMRISVRMVARMWLLRKQPVPEQGARLSNPEMQAWMGLIRSFVTRTDPGLAAHEQAIEAELRGERRQ